MLTTAGVTRTRKSCLCTVGRAGAVYALSVRCLAARTRTTRSNPWRRCTRHTPTRSKRRWRNCADDCWSWSVLFKKWWVRGLVIFCFGCKCKMSRKNCTVVYVQARHWSSCTANVAHHWSRECLWITAVCRVVPQDSTSLLKPIGPSKGCCYCSHFVSPKLSAVKLEFTQ